MLKKSRKKRLVRLLFCQDKKSQITVFVLLAVLILAVVIFIIFSRTRIATKESGAEVSVSQNLPDAVQQVETFVTSCLDDISKDALILAGRQAGLIDTATVDIPARAIKIKENQANTKALQNNQRKQTKRQPND